MRHTKAENTLAKVKQGLIQLLSEKSFSSITVSDIARQADINRGTFYIHYLDKYDLLEKLENTIIDDLENILEPTFAKIVDFRKNKKQIISINVANNTAAFLDNERDLLIALMGENGDPGFVAKVKNRFATKMHQELNKIEFESQAIPKIPLHYIQEVILNTVIYIYIYWIVTNQPESPKEIAQIVVNLVQSLIPK